MQLSTEGIVLRDYQIEDDRILTVLTRDYGVLTAFANGARRPRSAMAASTELLCYSQFQLFRSREKNVVDKADLIRGFFGLRLRVEDLALACYFAQLTGELAPKEEEAGEYINLLLNCLHALEGEKRPPLQLKSVIELRLLTLSGYMPDLVGCGECGEFSTESAFFSLEGQMYCQNCAKGKAGLYPLGGGVLAAMRHILYAEPKKLLSFSLSEEGFRALGRISESYLLHQLERTLPTLEYYRTVKFDNIIPNVAEKARISPTAEPTNE